MNTGVVEATKASMLDVSVAIAGVDADAGGDADAMDDDWRVDARGDECGVDADAVFEYSCHNRGMDGKRREE
tara:strand:+ start:325 stop:540 length:216 start_codon:yes stop_codon:yes gene_type:complete